MDSKTINKLLKIILITLVISYAIDKLVFLGLNTMSDKVMTGQAIGKLNQFLTIKDSTDFLVFGNSRANHHFDMDLFNTKGYNMGVDGTGIAYTSTLVSTLKKDKPQLILIHIDTKNFFDKSYDGSDIRGLKTKFNRDENITKALNKSNQISAIQNFYYSMNYNGNAISILKNYFKPSYDYRSYNGYNPIIINESQKPMRDALLLKDNSVGCEEDFEINPIALEYLKSIKTYIENSENKTFIFVTSPIYDDSCSKDNNLFKGIMKDLNLNYSDYTNLFKEIGNDKSYWKDKTHLSDIGAKQFSKFLQKELKTQM
ncbi:hypothetical protein [Winogradskyella algicola]|uniref:hypothetical protein n=1 Tax=Winogradskyella algicola TaxID=2575815 RepID=UPI001109AA26|nr:hypothetical protein [Winogradskyella algicola]